MKNEPIKIFDTVALLKDLPLKMVVFGQVGTVVEILGDGIFEVEFADNSGETIAEFAVDSKDLMLLHHKLELVEK